jgi:hypothetical protein
MGTIFTARKTSGPLFIGNLHKASLMIFWHTCHALPYRTVKYWHGPYVHKDISGNFTGSWNHRRNWSGKPDEKRGNYSLRRDEMEGIR